jgi:hypothetical protein
MKLKTQKSKSELSFQARAISALGISAIADVLDYAGAPIFALPIIGDVTDVIMMTLLYRLTGSKTSAAINTIELIPFMGDFIPTYTITTLVWILRELGRRNSVTDQIVTSQIDYSSSRVINPGKNSNGETIQIINSESETLRTRFKRAYSIIRGRSSVVDVGK